MPRLRLDVVGGDGARVFTEGEGRDFDTRISGCAESIAGVCEGVLFEGLVAHGVAERHEILVYLYGGRGPGTGDEWPLVALAAGVGQMIIGQMNKVFHFDAPRARYHCDAAILWCFDSRFELGLRKYLHRLGIVNIDPIKIAGGAKCLATPELESDREFVLEQIRKSIKLHGTKRVILKVHSDCGAYGGLDAFDNDPRREAEHHCVELHKAAACLRSAIPDLEILAFYVDFEGIWQEEV